MSISSSVAEASSLTDANAPSSREIHLYYPAEGFGVLYHRSMLNKFFMDFVGPSKIKTVAEAPLDSYGMVGAGSLIFTRLGRAVTFISQDKSLLERGTQLIDFNAAPNVSYINSSLDRIPAAADTFDFLWNYERIQATSNPVAVTQELCRVAKAVMIVVPNKYNYGQYPHYLYHRAAGNTCDYVGPNPLMRVAPVRQMLKGNGLVILKEGIIDIPWWPLFPELPNLVRGLLRRAPVVIDATQAPETNPEVVSLFETSKIEKRIAKAAIIERSPKLPHRFKLLFAHSAYVIGCKPKYRVQLGL